jgi:hypothetical protein
MVRMALKLWRKQKKSVNRYNRFHKNKKEIPQLYSNIPIRVGKYSRKVYKQMRNDLIENNYDLLHVPYERTRFCTPLTIRHLLNQERIIAGSITVVTELGKVASQYEWQNLNVQEHMNDFISMYRQYTLGGYFLCDDQSSDNIAVTIRRRLGTVINMLHFKRFWKFYWVKMRNITVSEDIKTIEEDSAEDNMRTALSMFPLFYRNYDTYAFSQRYVTVPYGPYRIFMSFKTNEILTLPHTEKITYQGVTKIKGLFVCICSFFCKNSNLKSQSNKINVF